MIDFIVQLRDANYFYRPEKAELLQRSRGISLDEVIAQIKGNGLIWAEYSQVHRGEYVLIVMVGNRILAVPVAVFGARDIYVKTAYQDHRIERAYRARRPAP